MSKHSPSPSADSQTLQGTTSSHDGPTTEAATENTTKDVWLNRHATTSAVVPINSQTQFHWRLTRALLKDGTLNLYKPPPEVTIRYFDPSIKAQQQQQYQQRQDSDTPTPSSATFPNQTTSASQSYHQLRTPSTPTTHKRVMSTATTSASLSTMHKSRESSTLASRIQYRGTDRHPDLDYDGRGRICSGTDEAICHTILFGESDEFTVTAVQLMPLLSDIVTMLEMLTDFAAGALGARSTATAGAKSSVISRLNLVVNTVLEKFPGMLLDSTIIAALMYLLETISAHDDPLGNDLKRSVFEKQKSMTDILSYSTHQEPILWSVQPRLQEKVSERLRAFMNRVETSQAVSGGSGNGSSSQQPKLITTVQPEIFLDVTTEAWASQIYYFHLAFSRDWSPTNDISLLFGTKYQYHRHSPLVFDSTNIHFLGRLLIDHLFGNSKRLESNYRGRLIKHWIDLGNELKGCGDMVGWLAIATVLCSVPVMRLRDAWSNVSNELRERVVKEWAPVVFDLERRLMIADMSKKSTYHVLAPQGIGVSYPKERVVPFFGDLCVKHEEGSTYRQCEGRLNRIKTAFQKWDDYLENIPQNDTFDPPPVPVPAIQKLLYSLLKNHYETAVPTPEQILHMSLKAEPAAGGHYLKHHYVQRPPLVTGSFLPLLFTETSPSYKLFDRSALIAASGVPAASNNKRSIRGSRNNASTVNVGEPQQQYGTMSNIASLRHGSIASVASNDSPNTSTASLQHSQHNGTAAGIQRSNSFPPATRQATTTGVMDVDYTSRQFFSKHSSPHVLMKNVRDVLNVGTHLYHLGNDIIVKSFEDESSRPSSVIETPSRRHSSQSRPVSSQFNKNNTNSSPREVNGQDYTSAKTNTKSSIHVVVRAANLERLVDILVLGINQFNCFLNPLDLGVNADSQTPTPQLKIDMDANTLTFFATFRSFCSPMDLLESLKKRFLGARVAAVSIVEMNKRMSNENRGSLPQEPLDSQGFPYWEPECDEPSDQIPWKTVAQIQMGVLEACHLWVSQYFGDFVNDLNVRDGFLELLKQFERELEMWKEPSAMKEDYKSYLKSIETLHKKVRKLFIKKSYRPNDVKVPVPKPSSAGSRAEPLLMIGDGSIPRIEKLVDDINTVVAGYFQHVHLNDWIELFETLEVQSAEHLGFFNYREPPHNNEEDLVIQDIFSYMDTLYRDKPEERVMDMLPHPIRELFKLHQNVSRYVTSEICSPALQRDDRIAKMVTALKVLGVIRHRMKNVDLFPGEEDNNSADSSGISTNMPVFLESAFIQAILRPESRMFANSWLEAGRLLSAKYECQSVPTSNGMPSLNPFIPEIPENEMRHESKSRPLVPCVGWIVERMLEIVCYVPNLSLENNTLINFDKRRYVYNLITNIMDLKDDMDADLSVMTPDSPFLRRMAYIVAPDKNLFHINRRNVRDAAYKEAKEYSKGQSKNRVFTQCVSMEMDKVKRDARQFDAMERHAKEQQKRLNQKVKQTSGGSSIHTSSGVTAVAGSNANEKKARSRFGGLLKAVRPISMALSGSFNNTQSTEKIITPSQLPELASLDSSKCKLIFRIDLGEASISSLRPLRLPCCFKVVSRGIDNVFQATSEEDADSWVEMLNQSHKYAKLMMSRAGPPRVENTGFFEQPVSVICEREGRNVPKIVEKLLAEVEERGLDEVGLYRVSGSLQAMNLLKSTIDSTSNHDGIDLKDDRWYDINAVAGVFKAFLRELPETLFTCELFDKFAAATKANDLVQLRQVANELPAPNFYILRRVFQHLALVDSNQDVNKMHVVNLSIVFSMSFIPRNSTSATSSVSNDLGAMQNFMKVLISSYDTVFKEYDAESLRQPHDGEQGSEEEMLEPHRPSQESPRGTPATNAHEDAPNETTSTDGNIRESVATSGGSNRDSFAEVSAY